ncbi:MAG TPA: Flp pilus assembly protein CpaB [Mycobacteriales bacterium]|nr:Flp pilus assembly protein CpaB [Mycobacteriales bacterium]
MTAPSSARAEFAAIRDTVVDAFYRNRRLATAMLAAVAVVFAISALRGGRGATVKVWVASHDLGGGEPLHRSDLALASLPRSDVPAGVLATRTAPVGVMLGAPVRRGEPLTDVRVLSPFLLSAVSPRDVAVPVRVTDGPAALALIRPGERVAVIASTDSGLGATGAAHTVVPAVRVLAMPDHPTDEGFALVIVAATPRQATRLAAIPGSDRVTVAVRR